MPASRLRLRFALWFAVAFLIGIAGFETLLFVSLRRNAIDRLSETLVGQAATLSRFLAGEIKEAPNADRATTLREGLDEFLPATDPGAVFDTGGRLIAYHGPEEIRRSLPDSIPVDSSARLTTVGSGRDHPYRLVTLGLPGRNGFVGLVGRTDAMQEELDSILEWMLGTAPLVVLLSAAGGYLLSRRAVRPMEALAASIRALPAADRGARLPVRETPDEVDQLAVQFNSLLDRLRTAESENRRFVQEAAHQIRTPLTIVLGETDLTLAVDADPADHRAALGRVHRAASQMKRRVDELFLLAHTEAEASVALSPDVDLEGLAFDVTDLMRGRAASTAHRFELDRVDPRIVLGNEPLLREALIELLENACRHGKADSTIKVSAFAVDGIAHLEVENAGEPVPPPATGQGAGHGLGLRILDWIARQHGGRLVVERANGLNVVALRWPSVILLSSTEDIVPVSD